jgi:two-component system chemotaxis response regulator CheV
MSRELLDRIDQRIRLAGHNRLALLLFRLGTRQLFGVNVFKVQEVLPRPPLFRLPQLPRAFASAADVRGRTVPVLDLAHAIGQEPSAEEPRYLVVTEFSRSIQGFLCPRSTASSTSRSRTSCRRPRSPAVPATANAAISPA